MTLFDDLARTSRVNRPETELRYHGGPLDGQAHTWPLAAVPPQIPVGPVRGPGGRQVRARRRHGRTGLLLPTPGAPAPRPGSAAHDDPAAYQLIELPDRALAIRALFQDSRGRHASLQLHVPPPAPRATVSPTP